MNNPLDLFAWKLRAERKRQHLTQKALAERLHMSVRTIIEIEKCKSNPKFETVALNERIQLKTKLTPLEKRSQYGA